MAIKLGGVNAGAINLGAGNIAEVYLGANKIWPVILGYSMFSWGYNGSYELGLNDTTNRSSPTQIGTDTWKHISADVQSCLAIKSDNTLWGWGANSYSILGLNDTTARHVPTQVGTDEWKTVSVGRTHAAGIKTDGTIWAWGSNYYGQLGLNDKTNRGVPTQVGTDEDWDKVECYGYFTAAIKADGSLYTWGSNTSGQLGLGDTTERLVPVNLGSSAWKDLAHGSYEASLGQWMGAIKSDGTLWMWGSNALKALGTSNYAGEVKTSPVNIIGLHPDWYPTDDWNELVISDKCTAAINVDGTLWGWGTPTDGQLYPLSPYAWFPQQVGTDDDWKHIRMGMHTLAIKDDGTLWTWGKNNYGQCGNGTPSTDLVTTQIGTDDTWVSLSCGYAHSLALKR